MTFNPNTWIFDGHNDVLSVLERTGDPLRACDEFLTGLPGNIDLPKMKSGKMVCGFFAIWISGRSKAPSTANAVQPNILDIKSIPSVPREIALDTAKLQLSLFERLVANNGISHCISVDEIRNIVNQGKIAAILHMEGAEAIGEDLSFLDFLYEKGLRSLGPVWSRDTIFAHGVPFVFNSSPDIGPGLTEAGFRLVKRCNELGVLIDLSHMNEAGFWDIAKSSDAPLVATHSNAHAICPHSRNLTDKQLAAIKESGGMVGLNFGTAFLRPDGRRISDCPPSILLQHLDHLIAHLGEDHVGFGSDFDGTLMPDFIGDSSGLPNLVTAMSEHGYDRDLIQKLCHENWLRVLDKTWKA
jgi:membrane dipeptidase